MINKGNEFFIYQMAFMCANKIMRGKKRIIFTKCF